MIVAGSVNFSLSHSRRRTGCRLESNKAHPVVTCDEIDITRYVRLFALNPNLKLVRTICAQSTSAEHAYIQQKDSLPPTPPRRKERICHPSAKNRPASRTSTRRAAARERSARSRLSRGRTRVRARKRDRCDLLRAVSAVHAGSGIVRKRSRESHLVERLRSAELALMLTRLLL